MTHTAHTHIANHTGYLYLHGFLSSAQSDKARMMRNYFGAHGAKDQLITPDLPFEPDEAIDLCEQHLHTLGARFDRIGVISSSLGGYYATYLLQTHQHTYKMNAALINPAVKPYLLFRDYLGPVEHYHTGQTHELTLEHVEHLKAFDAKTDNGKVAHHEHFAVWLQTGDETLDYREALAHYGESQCRVQTGGHHGFAQFEQIIPDILAFIG